MRVVLDTNILIGALITRGTPPDTLYRAWLRGRIKLITSTAQIDELDRVLVRPRLRKYLDVEEAAIIRENIDTRAHVVSDLPRIALSPDPADNLILATAIAGEADMIVSGDKRDMLALGEAEGIPILTALAALTRLTGQ